MFSYKISSAKVGSPQMQLAIKTVAKAGGLGGSDLNVNLGNRQLPQVPRELSRPDQ